MHDGDGIETCNILVLYPNRTFLFKCAMSNTKLRYAFREARGNNNEIYT